VIHQISSAALEQRPARSVAVFVEPQGDGTFRITIVVDSAAVAAGVAAWVLGVTR
jgi:hypothetical protein